MLLSSFFRICLAFNFLLLALGELLDFFSLAFLPLLVRRSRHFPGLLAFLASGSRSLILVERLALGLAPCFGLFLLTALACRLAFGSVFGSALAFL